MLKSMFFFFFSHKMAYLCSEISILIKYIDEREKNTPRFYTRKQLGGM